MTALSYRKLALWRLLEEQFHTAHSGLIPHVHGIEESINLGMNLEVNGLTETLTVNAVAPSIRQSRGRAASNQVTTTNNRGSTNTQGDGREHFRLPRRREQGLVEEIEGIVIRKSLPVEVTTPTIIVGPARMTALPGSDKLRKEL